ncbi:hypothetical protein [Spirosoma sp. KNUC1025]|uniref:hypothetical protein n=1 Tax=Spirosoma sp. KNUC1025 TaxID=2894082 RepID=UPI00386C064B|nr:hypothetical protein LN737_06105 [Spirosoma sp. KNUC1025]
MLDRLLLLYEKYPLDFITHLSSSLPILFGIVRYKYLNTASKLIVSFFLFFFIKETYGTWLAVLKVNNYFLQNLETIAQTWIVLAIALLCFRTSGLKRLSVILGIICSIACIITYQSDAISSVSLSSFRLFAIFFCLAYFNKILIDIQVKNILLHTLFWFSTGLLIYSTGTFFIVLFSEYWYKDINKVPAEVFDKYWNVGQVLFIIFALLSALGLWTSKYDRENLL